MIAVRAPSPVARGFAAFAVGVACGLFLTAWWGAAAACAAAGLHSRLRLLAAVVAVGIAHGRLARVVDREACPRRVAVGPVSLTVRLLEPAIPGRPVRAGLVGGACRGSLTVRHRLPDTLAAGTTWRAEGRWIADTSRWRRAGGLLAIRAVEPTSGAASDRSERLRNWLGRTIRDLYGPRAGLIEALVLGSRGTLDPALSAGFARSGLVHLLSISGFHVGLVWAWVVLGFGLVGRRREAPILASVLVGGYVGFIGFPAPAVRALALAVMDAWLQWRQRRPAVGSLSAAVGWIVLLADPWALTDLGGWLSVTAMWGAIAASRWADGAGGVGPVGAIVASSAGATIATAPLAALVLGSVSFVGIVLNVVAIPLAAVAMPAALLSVVVAGLSSAVAGSLAAGAGLLLDLLERLAILGASLPGAATTFEPGLEAAIGAAGLAALVAWVFGRRNRWNEVRRRLVWVTAVASVASLGGNAVRWGDGAGPALHFLDVGQGDAVAVVTGLGRWVLVDAGPVDARGDAGRRVVVPFLMRHGARRLALALVSHAHRDHFGGLASVVAAIPTDVVAEPGIPVPDREYLALLDAVDDAGTEWRPLRAGDRFVVDDVEFGVVHPDPAWPGFGVDLNENSLVIHLRTGAFDAILTGDAGLPVESMLLQRLGQVELLKVGHHGSRTATGADWLRTLRPRAAIVSVGSNGYGHPAPETMERLREARVPVWRTDEDGTVSIVPTTGAMRVRGRRGEVVLPLHD